MGSADAARQAPTSRVDRIRLEWGIAGWILVGLNGFLALGSTGFFLCHLKLGWMAWLMLNACAPSVFLFIAGFLTRSLATTAASAVLLFRYGLHGLLLFGWQLPLIGAQIGHTLMVLAGIYVLTSAIRLKAWRDLKIGLLLGLAILTAYTVAQGIWCHANSELLEQYLSGELMRGAS